MVSGHLVATTGMDGVVKVWSPWSYPKGNESKPVRSITNHKMAVQDLSWNFTGNEFVTASFDSTANLTNLETGCLVSSFMHKSPLNCVKFCPNQTNVFVSGESNDGLVSAWDIRAPSKSPIWTVRTPEGRILDLEFSQDGSNMFVSLHCKRRGGMDQPISVWDARKQIPLANQVYMEGFICPSLKYHPNEEKFVAQSHGEYIAIFSGKHPFKLNKFKRFEGHQVSGFRIQCCFSADGLFLATGSADGKTYIYSWKTGEVVKVLDERISSCVSDVSWHPTLPSTVATCSWDGALRLWE